MVIPNSVTSIGAYAFSNCKGLTSAVIPNSVTSIGQAAFSDVTKIIVEEGNERYDSRNNCNAIIETECNTLVAGCASTVIPDTVEEIGEYAFDDCSSLTSITIPPSVTEIGEYAFCGCSSLTSITIPESVTEFGKGAFYDCPSLTEVRIPKGCYVAESAFEDCPNVQIIRY